MNILYISTFYPDCPKLFYIPLITLSEFNNNLEEIFDGEDFWKMVTERDFENLTIYDHSSGLTSETNIDKIYITNR